MGWLSRVAMVLAHPRWPWVAALLGVLLASSSLGSGLVLDDHLHRFVVELYLRGEGPGAWWDLYVAAEGDEALTRARIELGFAPWWTAPDLRVQFLRPLSAATHYLDYALWPDADGDDARKAEQADLADARELTEAVGLDQGSATLEKAWAAADQCRSPGSL